MNTNHPPSPLVQRFVKRMFDIVMSAAGLVLLSPLFALCALAVKLDSRGPALFRQRRVGRDFRTFEILKFRSMVENAPALGRPLTVGDDARITTVGRVLRACKFDELPQLFNVLVGDMSFVGPRPESPTFVEMFRDDYRQILTVRPGITDIASLKYRNEAELLATSDNPEEAYLNEVLPDKIRLARKYIAEQSLQLDLRLIVQTLFALGATHHEGTAVAPPPSQHRRADPAGPAHPPAPVHQRN